MTKRWFLTLSATALITPWSFAQERKPVTPADYGRWENLASGVLSRDGRWLAVPIARVDGTAELRLHRASQPAAPADRGAVFTASEGRDPAFTDDGRWLAYRIGQAESERGRLQDEKKPIHDGRRDAVRLLARRRVPRDAALRAGRLEAEGRRPAGAQPDRQHRRDVR